MSSILDCSTLVEILARRAVQKPTLRAYAFLADGRKESGSFTYAEIDQRARAVARGLRERGLEGERVLLLFQPGLGFVATFWGCLYAGVVAVPLMPPSSVRLKAALPRLVSVVKDARAKAVACEPELVELLRSQAPELEQLQWLTPADFEDAPWEGPAPRPNQTAFLQYTSGSTGSPRGVVVTHGNVFHNEHRIHRSLTLTDECHVVGWTPLEHDMGLMVSLFLPVFSGAFSIMMSPLTFLKRPLAWLEAIQKYRGVVCGGPNFAYELLLKRVTKDQIEKLDLSSWNRAFVSAEPVRADTMRRFIAAFEPAGMRSWHMSPAYGLAESTLMVSIKPDRVELPLVDFCAASLDQGRVVTGPATSSNLRTLVSSGRPTRDDQEIAIVDPETRRACAADVVGEIWLRSPSVAAGYFERPELNAEVFAAQIEGTDGGVRYFRTGDLGFQYQDELFVVGRLKDLIIIDGLNHHATDVEDSILRAHPILRGSSAAVFPVENAGRERAAAVVEVRRRDLDETSHDQQLDAISTAIREFVSEEHGIGLARVALVRSGAIPRTSSGKVQRYLCARMLATDAFELLQESHA